MTRLPLLSVFFLFALCAAPAIVSAETLSGCDFNGDGSDDAATVERGRIVRSAALPGGKLKLDGRYEGFRCVDMDGDGIDEVITTARTRVVSFAAPPPTATRALKQACKNIRGLFRGEIYKSIASHHITDGRAHSTSFITLRNTTPPKKSCLYGYDKNGTLVHKLGQYYPSGAAYSSRFYGGFGCGDRKTASSVAAIARRNAGSPEIYITSGTGNCAKVPDANRCYNSAAC